MKFSAHPHQYMKCKQLRKKIPFGMPLLKARTFARKTLCRIKPWRRSHWRSKGWHWRWHSFAKTGWWHSFAGHHGRQTFPLAIHGWKWHGWHHPRHHAWHHTRHGWHWHLITIRIRTVFTLLFSITGATSSLLFVLFLLLLLLFFAITILFLLSLSSFTFSSCSLPSCPLQRS